MTIMRSSQCLRGTREAIDNEIKTEPIRVILADRYPIIRYGLRELLTVAGDFEIVGEASNAREAAQVPMRPGPIS
jgi:hypothetical protein